MGLRSDQDYLWAIAARMGQMTRDCARMPSESSKRDHRAMQDPIWGKKNRVRGWRPHIVNMSAPCHREGNGFETVSRLSVSSQFSTAQARQFHSLLREVTHGETRRAPSPDEQYLLERNSFCRNRLICPVPVPSLIWRVTRLIGVLPFDQQAHQFCFSPSQLKHLPQKCAVFSRQ